MPQFSVPRDQSEQLGADDFPASAYALSSGRTSSAGTPARGPALQLRGQ